MNLENSFAEIIESSLIQWKAECWNWDIVPCFGSLVTIKGDKRIIFGIVTQIETGSNDAIRVPFAYKKNEEELKREQPQIFEFLKTTFSCITVGFLEDNKLLYQMVPEPPKIHAFVNLANIEQTKLFFSNELYLYALFSFQNQNIYLDELLLSIIKILADLNILNEEIMSRFLETFSLLTANDYRRLKIFLQRAEPILNKF